MEYVSSQSNGTGISNMPNMLIDAQRAPDPLPVDDPAPPAMPHPAPQDDPVPDHHPS